MLTLTKTQDIQRSNDSIHLNFARFKIFRKRKKNFFYWILESLDCLTKKFIYVQRCNYRIIVFKIKAKDEEDMIIKYYRY